MKKIFIVKIQLEIDSYEFKKGEIIQIPVLTSSARNAEEKVLEKYMSSEYPTFKILEVTKEHILFKPLFLEYKKEITIPTGHTIITENIKFCEKVKTANKL
jgi:hypothetical protein